LLYLLNKCKKYKKREKNTMIRTLKRKSFFSNRTWISSKVNKNWRNSNKFKKLLYNHVVTDLALKS